MLSLLLDKATVLQLTCRHPPLCAAAVACRLAPGHLITGVNNWLACMTADAVIKATCNVDMDNIARRARGKHAFDPM